VTGLSPAGAAGFVQAQQLLQAQQMRVAEGARASKTWVVDILDIMKQEQKTSDGKNIITQTDNNTKAIFRMNAHQWLIKVIPILQIILI
jgi:hypothetical protein